MLFKSIGSGIITAVLAASLVACGPGQQQSTGSNTSDSSQPVAPNTSAAGATLTVQPAAVDGCKPNQSIIATVSWHSKDPHVRVMVGTPGHTGKLFSEGGFTGSAKTEQWVQAGTEFTLVDAQTGAVLARQTVTEGACK